MPPAPRQGLPPQGVCLVLVLALGAVLSVGCEGASATLWSTPAVGSAALPTPVVSAYPLAAVPGEPPRAANPRPPVSATRAPSPPALARPGPSNTSSTPTEPQSGEVPAGVPLPTRTDVFLPLVVGGGQSGGTTVVAAATPTATPTESVPTPAPSEPTATPVPPPTATPRVKPPPSPYRRLQDFPRPAGDSGYGFHVNASPYLPSKEVLQSQVIPLLRGLGATWVTVWASSDAEDQVESVRLLVDSGFEVILRLHDVQPPHAGYVPPIRALQRYRAVGVRYFVTGNEPNLLRENPSRAGPDLVAQQWVKSADLVKAVGGIPLLYPMSPGGGGDVADHREMLLGILEWLKRNDALDTLDGAGVAIHNRPLGKPLEFRDSTSFLEYEWIDDTVARYAGKHLPLFGTEAGYAFGEQVVPSFPRVDGELHKRYNLAIITGFRDGRWRDSLFTQTFWILSGFGHRDFLGDWWVANPLNYGQDLPIVDALRALPKFTRKFSAPGFETRPLR